MSELFVVQHMEFSCYFFRVLVAWFANMVNNELANIFDNASVVYLDLSIL